MNTMGWVFLCIAMLPAYLAMGFIIYFARASCCRKIARAAECW